MRERASKVKARKRRRRHGEIWLRDRIEYALLRFAVVLLRALPVDVGPALMGAGWQLIGPWTARHKRALGNLALAFPELDEAARRKIAADQWNNLGRTFAESFMIDRIVADPQRIALVTSPALESRLRQGGGFIVAGIHSANWEIACYPIRDFRSVAGLYQNILNPLVNEYRGQAAGPGVRWRPLHERRRNPRADDAMAARRQRDRHACRTSARAAASL